jgi:hypothetical protein
MLDIAASILGMGSRFTFAKLSAFGVTSRLPCTQWNQPS